MKIIDVDEARNMSGFYSLSESALVSKVDRAVREAAKEDQTSVTIEVPRHKLQKYAVKEAREVFEDNGFIVSVSDAKGPVKLNISWFMPKDRTTKLIF